MTHCALCTNHNVHCAQCALCTVHVVHCAQCTMFIVHNAQHTSCLCRTHIFSLQNTHLLSAEHTHLPCLHNAEGVTLGSPRSHFGTTFSTFFGLFRGCPRSVPMTFRHHRKVSPRHSRGVLGQFFRLFSDMFRKVPRYFSKTPGQFLDIF